jgi:tetratricopeptide (TPR) repeat protein
MNDGLMNKMITSVFGFLILICPVTGTLHAQQQKIDSLVGVLANTPRDTIRLPVLHELYRHTVNIDSHKALKYSMEGIALSKEFGSTRWTNVFLNDVGNSYYNLGSFDSAYTYFHKRLDLTTALKDTLGIAGSMDNIGVILFHRGDMEKALELRREANEIYSKINHLQNLINGYIWIGNMYNHIGDYEQALQNYIHAKIILLDYKDENLLATTMINISMVYRHLKQYDNALDYAKQASQLFDTVGNHNGKGVALYRLSLIYENTGEYDKAIKSIREAEQVFLHTGNTYFLNHVYNALGDWCLKESLPDEALEHLNKSLSYAKTSGNKELLSTTYHNMSEAYFQKNDYPSALDFLKQTETLYLESGDKLYLRGVFLDYIKIYGYANKPDSIVKYLIAYENLNDTLINEQTIKAVAEVQEKYQAEKKEKEILLLNVENEKKQFSLEKLEQENRIANLELMQAAIENEKSRQDLQLANAERENQLNQINILTLNDEVREQKLQQEKREKTFLIIGFVVLFLAGGVITYYILISYRNRKQKEEARLKQEAAELSRKLMETNMKAINFQLNPHFIFNCVHTVEYLLGQSKVKESMACLRKFSNLIRMMLEGMSKKEIPLDRELEILRLYMDLEKMRHTHDFSYSIETDSRIDPVTTMVPPLILQPFVENSIKHGFVQDGKEYHIRIRLQAEEGKLYCEITDNGVGFSAKKDQMSVSGFKKESLGLKLTEDRLRLINQMTSLEYSWSIGDMNDEENNTTGTIVSLQLPYILAA